MLCLSLAVFARGWSYTIWQHRLAYVGNACYGRANLLLRAMQGILLVIVFLRRGRFLVIMALFCGVFSVRSE